MRRTKLGSITWRNIITTFKLIIVSEAIMPIAFTLELVLFLFLAGMRHLHITS